MTNGETSIAEAISNLGDRGKAPASVRALDTWIASAERAVGPRARGRVGWLVTSTVASAKLMQVLAEDGTPAFALKGGTLLQYRLELDSRATRDIDGIVRCDMGRFEAALDEVLGVPWGAISFSRGPMREFSVPGKAVNLRRFDLAMSISGKLWRRVKVEISPDEGANGTASEPFAPPSLAHFGLPTPEALVGISMAYQIAEKYHAASDPHEPPLFVNDRARDVVDLVLLGGLVEETGVPAGDEIAAAVRDIFDSRAAEAEAAGRPARRLPAPIVAYPHWASDYERAAKSAGINLTLEAAVEKGNTWLESVLDTNSGTAHA